MFSLLVHLIEFGMADMCHMLEHERALICRISVNVVRGGVFRIGLFEAEPDHISGSFTTPTVIGVCRCI